MKQIKIKLFSPGGNTTALIEQAVGFFKNKLAQEIIKTNPEVEQVGFLNSDNELNLVMMGDELCINAAQCAALLWSQKLKQASLQFRMSGLNNEVAAEIWENQVTLKFDNDLIVKTQEIPEGWLVDLQGIRYVITLKLISSHKDAEEILNAYKKDTPAVGLISLTIENNNLDIVPWIWVEATNTLINETACGSGSIAAAIVARQEDPQYNLFYIKQPSGSIYKISLDGKIEITNTVEYLGEKEMITENYEK